MTYQQDILLALSTIDYFLAYKCLKNRTLRPLRSKWLRAWLKKKHGRGIQSLLNTELKIQEPDAFKNFRQIVSSIKNKFFY